MRGWKCKNPDLPVLFVAGREDPCIGGVRGFEQAVSHMRYVGYRDVSAKLYEGMRHEILNEKKKEQVYKDILRYAEEKIRQK